MSSRKSFFTKIFSKVASKEKEKDKENFSNVNHKVSPPRVVNRYEYNLNDDNFSFQNQNIYSQKNDYNNSSIPPYPNNNSSYNQNNNIPPYNNNSFPINQPYNVPYHKPFADDNDNIPSYDEYENNNWNSSNSNTNYFNNNNSYTNYQQPEQPLLDPLADNYRINDNINDNYIPAYQQEANSLSLNTNSNNYRPLSIKVLPKEIANEVRSEKYRLLSTMIIGILGFFLTIIPLILWFLKKQDLVIDTSNIIPHPTLMTPLCIIALGLFFISLFDRIRIKKEVETYLKNIQLGNNNVIPNFIIQNYKKMHVRSIIINWIAFPSYIIGALIIALLYILSEAHNPRIFGFILLEVTIRNLSPEIIILTIILFAIFFLQVLNIILVRKRKANILGFYGYEIVNPYEMSELKRKINRRCLIIWLVIIGTIGIVITIPILIIRRKKKVTS